MAKQKSDLLHGTLDALILKTLSWQPMHGYAISRWIRQRTDNVLTVEDAALYQALHRLERKGLIESEWGLSENNRKAKYYQLTQTGRQQLGAEANEWRQYADELTEKANERLLGVLTEPQRERLEAMEGAPFELDFSQFRRGRGRD